MNISGTKIYITKRQTPFYSTLESLLNCCIFGMTYFSSHVHFKSLRNRTDIVIKQADKGGAVVVWDRDLYLEEAYKQLSDDRFYHQIDQYMTKRQHKEVTNVIGQAVRTCELPPHAKHLTVENPRNSKFYMIPKIHRVGNPGRPIVSACNCPTSNISINVVPRSTMKTNGGTEN